MRNIKIVVDKMYKIVATNALPVDHLMATDCNAVTRAKMLEHC